MLVDLVVQNSTQHDAAQRIMLSVAPGYNKHKIKERLRYIGNLPYLTSGSLWTSGKWALMKTNVLLKCILVD